MFTLKTFELGPKQNFHYVLVDQDTMSAVLIDPAYDFDKLAWFISGFLLTLKAVIFTHTHMDHCAALPQVLEKYGEDLDIYIHPAELKRIDPRGARVHLLHGGETIEIGSQTLKVHHTPGHQAGSLTYEDERYLFTGDTLFVDKIGRCNFPESSYEQMYHSLHDTLAHLDQNLMICPGHNYGSKPTSSLGEQLQTNPWLQYRGRKAEFISERSADELLRFK